MQLRRFLFLAATIAALSASQIFAAERVFDVTGIVRAPIKDGRIVITHEDIPGFMPAMTMGFVVANPAEAAALIVGDRVQFHFTVTETRSSAADFKIVSRDVSAALTGTRSTASQRLREGDRFPAFSLMNQEGQPLTVAALTDHLTVVTFIFSRCPVPEYCPAVALRFGQLQRAILANPRLATRARLLSISIDPEFDRPEILKAYGSAIGADPAIWQFATGEKSEIGALSAAFGVFTERNGVMLDHTLCTALIDGKGRVVELWRGGGWKADEIVAALLRTGAE